MERWMDASIIIFISILLWSSSESESILVRLLHNRITATLFFLTRCWTALRGSQAGVAGPAHRFLGPLTKASFGLAKNDLECSPFHPDWPGPV